MSPLLDCGSDQGGFLGRCSADKEPASAAGLEPEPSAKPAALPANGVDRRDRHTIASARR
jgi:hypothetical protein